MLLSEQCPIALETIRGSEQLLCCGYADFVADRLAADGVGLVHVLDFECSSGDRVDI